MKHASTTDNNQKGRPERRESDKWGDGDSGDNQPKVLYDESCLGDKHLPMGFETAFGREHFATFLSMCKFYRKLPKRNVGWRTTNDQS